MREIKNMQEFDDVLGGPNLVVVDFKADWCGPCRMIAPKLETLAEELKDREIIFIKVDVDRVTDVSRRAGISAMPTFHIYKNGELREEIVGADYPKLAATIMKELGPADGPAVLGVPPPDAHHDGGVRAGPKVTQDQS
jgi:thioredoxin 1